MCSIVFRTVRAIPLISVIYLDLHVFGQEILLIINRNFRILENILENYQQYVSIVAVRMHRYIFLFHGYNFMVICQCIYEQSIAEA